MSQFRMKSLPLLEIVEQGLGGDVYCKFLTDAIDGPETCHVTDVEMLHYSDILLDEQLSNKEAFRQKQESHMYSLLRRFNKFNIASRSVVTFRLKVTAKDDHVTPPSAVIDKPRQTWAEYAQSWIDYRKSLTPEPEHMSEAYKDTEENGLEPDYEKSQELEIARLVSAYNPLQDNNDVAESLLDSPSDLIHATTGQIRIT
jgi:hypothetical protein